MSRGLSPDLVTSWPAAHAREGHTWPMVNRLNDHCYWDGTPSAATGVIRRIRRSRWSVILIHVMTF
jgi:hypothetical protein